MSKYLTTYVEITCFQGQLYFELNSNFDPFVIFLFSIELPYRKKKNKLVCGSSNQMCNQIKTNEEKETGKLRKKIIVKKTAKLRREPLIIIII